jgi:hypothetical protein
MRRGPIHAHEEAIRLKRQRIVVSSFTAWSLSRMYSESPASWRLGAVIAAWAVLMALAPTSPGQEKPPETARKVRLVRASSGIKIDGRMDEPAWERAAPAQDFYQQNPEEGAPASEKTEVRVLYDGKYLYFGIRAADSEPAKINARELKRDADFSNDDVVEIVLDTNHDRRNAFRFAVNPLGTQQDALITDEGHTVNVSWDAPWLSAGGIDKDGFTVEIAIPLTSLRFNEGATAWGFNIARTIRRKNEISLWTAW